MMDTSSEASSISTASTTITSSTSTSEFRAVLLKAEELLFQTFFQIRKSNFSFLTFVCSYVELFQIITFLFEDTYVQWGVAAGALSFITNFRKGYQPLTYMGAVKYLLALEIPVLIFLMILFALVCRDSMKGREVRWYTNLLHFFVACWPIFYLPGAESALRLIVCDYSRGTLLYFQDEQPPCWQTNGSAWYSLVAILLFLCVSLCALVAACL